MKELIREIGRKIEIFIIERKERKVLTQRIKKLLDDSSKRYSDDLNSRLFYVESALKNAERKEAKEYEDYDGNDENGRPIIRRFYECPSCKRTVYPHQNYCSSCGQRLIF